MTVGLEVHSDIELLGGVVKVLHSSFSAPHGHLNHKQTCELSYKKKEKDCHRFPLTFIVSSK